MFESKLTIQSIKLACPESIVMSIYIIGQGVHMFDVVNVKLISNHYSCCQVGEVRHQVAGALLASLLEN